MGKSTVTGRFAPSPTGPLHFGSLVAAVGSYCLARRAGGRWLVRIEDLDTPRVVPGAAAEILFTLEALGFCWDGEIVWQSRRHDAYLAALEQLQNKGLLYDCACSRKEILASAPHPGEEGPVYPGTCRQGLSAGRLPRAVRVRVPDRRFSFTDGVFGQYGQNLAADVGDFILRRADGMVAYQLAVVVDDAASGVNQVVRGADLLGSTPRQIFLLNSLDLPVPAYLHLPLVLNADGSKISKRNGESDNPLAGGDNIIKKALEWLGQEIPAELRTAPPVELLAWGESCFDVGRIPAIYGNCR
ncbi:MAG: tRNA glutamyl-Q(34) synthetase GluQRS [Desulfuromonadales bacterium]|nr:tRNA glutamyl-Q(34) synthetase GluQRS [Desulfuromonadales bacterium]